MAYWLLKSEPDDWSWSEQVAKGSEGAEWTGIRNFSARNHLRAMKKGERAFFYHTGKEKAIVGIVRVIAEALVDTRHGAGVSQRQLAALAGVGHSMIAAYEAGRRHPTISTLTRILSAARAAVALSLARREP